MRGFLWLACVLVEGACFAQCGEWMMLAMTSSPGGVVVVFFVFFMFCKSFFVFGELVFCFSDCSV